MSSRLPRHKVAVPTANYYSFVAGCTTIRLLWVRLAYCKTAWLLWTLQYGTLLYDFNFFNALFQIRIYKNWN